MAAIKQTTLENGWELYYRNRLDLEILSREFQEDDVYNHDGIEINDGDCIFDVGAHIGTFLLWVGHRLNSAKVFCFEPIPETFEVLQRNATSADHLEVNLMPHGVSDSEGSAEFTLYSRLSMASTMFGEEKSQQRRNTHNFIVEELKSRSRVWRILFGCSPRLVWWPMLETTRFAFSGKKNIECRLRTLSSVIDENGVEQIDLLKVDVEGAEANVLSGIRDEHWDMIQQIVMETHNGIEDTKKIESELQARGFRTQIETVMPGVDHLNLIVAKR